eukprot:Clim_evm24s253 gene=Clim_evmTU24s253
MALGVPENTTDVYPSDIDESQIEFSPVADEYTSLIDREFREVEQEISARSVVHEREGNGTFFSSVANLTASCLGTGVLSLPIAFAKTGWLTGLIAIVFFGFLSDLTGVWLRNAAKRKGKANYEDLAGIYLGPTGILATRLSLGILLLLSASVLFIVAGDLLTPVLQLAFGDSESWYLQRAWVEVWSGLAILPLLCAPDLKALQYSSTLAVGFMLFVAGAMVYELIAKGGIAPTVKAVDTDPVAILQAVPLLSLVYMCHFNVLHIYTEMAAGVRHLFPAVMHTSLMGICTSIYFVFGLAGYFYFGRNVSGDILTEYPGYIMTFARGFVGLLNLLKFPLVFYPSVKLVHAWRYGDLEVTLARRAMFAVAFVGLCLVLALSLSHLDIGFQILGSTAAVAITFVIPGMIQYRKDKETHPKMAQMGLVVVIGGVLVGALGLAVTIVQIVDLANGKL